MRLVNSPRPRQRPSRRTYRLWRCLLAAESEGERQLLQRQIDSTDGESDALVYEPYGLSEEEIRIVEGSWWHTPTPPLPLNGEGGRIPPPFRGREGWGWFISLEINLILQHVRAVDNLQGAVVIEGQAERAPLY